MVSVIVPVYNAEKTLPICVHSILNQSYSDYELVLIDDGSKDRSGQRSDELGEACRERCISPFWKQMRHASKKSHKGDAS